MVKICTNCVRYVFQDETMCKKCGSKPLEADNCPKCGEDIDTYFFRMNYGTLLKVCPSCGTDFK
tara:strand:- start:336 stop:527 length:192 start_codon:yes stop_codon:yes gene_type:complete